MMKRGNFIRTTILSAAAAMVPGAVRAEKDNMPLQSFSLNTDPLKIGIMTYTIAKDWDIETIIKNLTEAGYVAAELQIGRASWRERV